MNKLLDIVPRWFPALVLMVVIFSFSSRTSHELPNFGGWDYFVKKSAHGIGYGLLALSYLRALPNRNYKLAWFLAVLYSLTDEFHQSFVPGRHSSLVDVFLFDNLGAVIVLFLHNRFYGGNYEKEIH
ncbi:MAG: VanZ family protein [Anaerolineales bacterium]|nr:VanZ family protein [Anaerolineales bacterium]MCB9144030.1 VanZ family protein [Anaerolineales bacterium]